MEIIKSQCDPELRFTRKYVQVKDIGDEHIGQSIRIRGRISSSRSKGNMTFVVVRESYGSVQAVLFVNKDKETGKENISKGMVKYAAQISKESIVEVVALVSKPDQHIDGCSQ